EQSVRLYQALGNRKYLARASNNLALIYQALGLQRKALERARLAVAMERERHALIVLAGDLDTLARCETDPAGAGAAYEGLLVLAEASEISYVVPFGRFGLGRLALAAGHPAEAAAEFEAARPVMERFEFMQELDVVTAWLGLAHL